MNKIKWKKNPVLNHYKLLLGFVEQNVQFFPIVKKQRFDRHIIHIKKQRDRSSSATGRVK